MQRYNSASSLSSQASGLLFSTPVIPRKNKSDNNKTSNFFHQTTRKQSSGPSLFSNIYINTTSTPCDFIRKRERTRSSLYSLDDGNDSGVYDRLKTPNATAATSSHFKHTRTPSIISTTNGELEHYDLTLNDDCDVPSLYEQSARKLTYSALSLESTSSASSTSCLNSNSLESEPSPKIKKIDVDEDNKRKEDGVDASHNISSKNTDSSKNIVYDELFYKELDKLQTEFTDITSIMSIVDARLDNILCNTELTLKNQHSCHNKLDNLELNVGQTKQDCEKLEWMQNRQSRMDDLRREKDTVRYRTNRNGSNSKSNNGYSRRSRELSSMPNVDRFLDEYYLTLNPKLPVSSTQNNRKLKKQNLESKQNTGNYLTSNNSCSDDISRSTSGFESSSSPRKRHLDKKNSSHKNKNNNNLKKNGKSTKSTVPPSLEYDTAHMDAVISQALASCQKKPSMRKKLMRKLMKSSNNSNTEYSSSTGYCSYAGFN